MANEWYVKLDGKTEGGPLTSDRLKQLALEGRVTPDTPVKKGQAGTWHLAIDVHGLLTTGNGHSAPAAPRDGPSPSSSEQIEEIAEDWIGLAAPAHWYLREEGKMFGPYSEAEVKEIAREGAFGPATQVKEGEHGNWVPLRQSTGSRRELGRVAARSERADLRRFASHQRGLIFSLLVQILVQIVIQYFLYGVASTGSLVLGVVSIRSLVLVVGVILLLVAVVVGWAYTILLATRLYSKNWADLLVILAFVPCVSTVVLLIINQAATKRLTENGIKVGFFGASMSQF